MLVIGYKNTIFAEIMFFLIQLPKIALDRLKKYGKVYLDCGKTKLLHAYSENS